MTHRALYLVCIIAFAAMAAQGQTTCGLSHPEPGIVICSPEAGENSPLTLPDIFHISAFGKASSGQKISAYRIFIDQELVEESRLTVGSDQLAIESNIKYPNRPGLHTLIVTMAGAGSAEVKKIRFTPATSSGFCDQITFVRIKSCYPASTGRLLQWSLKKPISEEKAGSEVNRLNADFTRRLALYQHNLKEIEADTADAVALDADENLYVARHSFSDVELRKYAPNGSVIYSGLLRACGDGLVTVTSAATAKEGQVWIAGNTNACLAGAGASKHDPGGESLRGFIALFDTKKANVTAPQVVRYVADEPVRISAIQTDNQGNLYVAGSTTEDRLAGAKNVSLPQQPSGYDKGSGFAAMLDPTGAAVKWSTCIRQVPIRSIAVDKQAKVFVAGWVGKQRSLFVGELSKNGSRMAYAANVGLSGIEHLALAITPKQRMLVVTGENHAGQRADQHSDQHDPQVRPFFLSVKPCSGSLDKAKPASDGAIRATGASPTLSLALNAAIGIEKRSLDLHDNRRSSGNAITIKTLISPNCGEGS